MSQKGTKPKETAAQRRAQEAIDRVSRSSSEPTKRVLDFLLAGSHQPTPTEQAIRQDPVSQLIEATLPLGSRTQESPSLPVPSQPTPSQPTPSRSEASSERTKRDKNQMRAAPPRDFNRRANSLERDALPAGLFPGSSKRLYDALYLRTRGAIVPTRTLQATKKDLMSFSAIKSKNTLVKQLKYLCSIGLVVSHIEVDG